MGLLRLISDNTEVLTPKDLDGSDLDWFAINKSGYIAHIVLLGGPLFQCILGG